MSPFVKRKAIEVLIAGRRFSSIRMITRFNLADCLEGVSDLEALRQLVERGALIKGVKALHSKLYLFDSRAAIIGSTNLTYAALKSNHELGVVLSDRTAISECSDHFERMWKSAGVPVTSARLSEWQETVSRARSLSRWRARRPNLGDFGVTVALVSEGGESFPPPPSERQVFVKFFGTGSERAPLNLPVLEEVSGTGSHWACTYPHNRRPRQVRTGDIMYFARMVAPPDYQIYGRGVALQYVPGRDDASTEEIEQRPWKAQWPRYIRVFGTEFLNGTLQDCVSLNQVMGEWGAQAFRSTSTNLLSGLGNTNPRAALRRAAHVQLSSGAADWLAGEFERRLQANGRLQTLELARLDHPESARWLSNGGLAILRLLSARLTSGDLIPSDRSSFPNYLQIAKTLGVAKRSWPGLGLALQRFGLDDLDNWTMRFQFPAVSGFLVREDTRLPGAQFFKAHGKNEDDERWWLEELRQAERFNWSLLVQ